MWTKAHRAKQARQERRSQRYPTDLTDTEWVLIEPWLPRPAKRGRRRSVDLREVLNAIRYLARTGCGWRMLPKDLPPWQTVYWWFRRLVRRLLFRTIHDLTLMLDREIEGRAGSPTGAILDSQSVKAPNAAERGYDAAKKITGRKRHIAVDTDGRLLMVRLTPADLSDSAGAQLILDALRKRWPWLKHLFGRRLRPWPPAQQGRLPGLHRRRDPASGRAKGLPRAAAPLGGGTDFRLADALAPARP